MIIKTPFNYPLKNENRTLHIYLPDNYYESDEHYPVAYYFDGHNLYNDEDATYGKSWGLKTFLENYDKKFIVVGMECTHVGKERLDEYCPYDLKESWLGTLKGYGKDTMEWIINDIKPYIDSNYRTMPFRETTMIAGSSMGGLMSLYAAIAYNIYFSKAACLSPSSMICEGLLKEEILNNKLSEDTRIYLSAGTGELRGSKDYTNIHIENLLKQRNLITYRVLYEGYNHCETDWEKQNQTYMNFLWY